ncbi:MAG: UpxY family transcription antiterminator [Nitrospirota bacterium]
MLITNGCNWYALYVKSRHEFTTMDELKRKGINTFLPFVKRLRQWKDRKKFIDFPLFPGYLFVSVRPNPEEFINVLKTRGAVSLVTGEPGHPVPVSEEEINSLKILIDSGEDLDIYPELKEGAGVRVKKGPLKGAVGKLAKKEERHIFLVNIDILGRSVGVKIFADDIEPD